MSDKYPHVGLFIDAQIIADKDLAWAEKAILAYVLGWWRQGKQCFAGSETIAQTLGLSPTWVRESRTKLVEKGYLVKYLVGEQLIFKPADRFINDTHTAGGVSAKPTGVSAKPTGGVGKTDRGCRENRHYNNIYDTIYENKERESEEHSHIPPVPDSQNDTGQKPAPGTKDWFLSEAQRYLDTADGKKNWERDNQFMTAGRRPMIKYPALWFTPGELADALETVTNALPQGCDIRPVFKLAQSEALSQSVQHNRKVSAYKYVTTFCLQQHQDTLKKGQQLLKTIQQGKR